MINGGVGCVRGGLITPKVPHSIIRNTHTRARAQHKTASIIYSSAACITVSKHVNGLNSECLYSISMVNVGGQGI